MTTLNILNVATINGKTTGVSLTTTAATSVLNNPASSSHCMKVNVLNVANTTATAANITISWYSAASLGGTAYPITSVVAVPGNATLNIIDKSSQYYLDENQSIGAVAGTANALIVTCSYEDMS